MKNYRLAQILICSAVIGIIYWIIGVVHSRPLLLDDLEINDSFIVNLEQNLDSDQIISYSVYNNSDVDVYGIVSRLTILAYWDGSRWNEVLDQLGRGPEEQVHTLEGPPKFPANSLQTHQIDLSQYYTLKSGKYKIIVSLFHDNYYEKPDESQFYAMSPTFEIAAYTPFHKSIKF